ncbi:MAG: DMT family transporter [Acidimicrobiia bacterium]
MSDTTSREHTGAILTALFVTVLWSSSWVLIRWGLDEEQLEPLTFAGIRYLLASLLLIGLVVATPRARGGISALGRAKWGQLALLGLVFVAVAQGAQFVAIDSQPAATSSLVLALTPLIVAAASTITLAERPSTRQVAGAVLIVLGAIAYFSGDLGFTVIGLLASVIGLVANAVGALMGRAVNRDRALAPVTVTVVSMSCGAIALMIAGVAAEGWPTITARAWLIILWLAVVNTAWAFTLWNRSLQLLSATESAAINNTMLIQIGLLAWVFLDETPGALDIVGMLAVSIGVYLAQRPRVEMRAPHEQVPDRRRR